MPVIKRYPNRKLYDTQAKQYITLEGIAALIRESQDVQVVDYATGEDLTALTLSQIIFEQEKRHGGFLPRAVLTGLIRSGGETLGTLRRTLVSSLGLARYLDDEIERRIHVLVGKGELAEEQGRSLLDKLVSRERWDHDGNLPSEHELESLLANHGVPTRDDLQQLAEQLDALADKLEHINPDAP
jgi:polyhydroxyalkanoate synthesis repressor PhaR